MWLEKLTRQTLGVNAQIHSHTDKLRIEFALSMTNNINIYRVYGTTTTMITLPLICVYIYSILFTVDVTASCTATAYTYWPIESLFGSCAKIVNLNFKWNTNALNKQE